MKNVNVEQRYLEGLKLDGYELKENDDVLSIWNSGELRAEIIYNPTDDDIFILTADEEKFIRCKKVKYIQAVDEILFIISYEPINISRSQELMVSIGSF